MPTVPSDGFCKIAPLAGKVGNFELTLSLTATTSPINVGGYRLADTDNYNGGYLPPTIELKAGDTFKVSLLNALASNGTPSAHDGDHSAHKHTNLHTHGLIVSPKNAKPDLPQNGDNIFASIGRGQSFDYDIEIPTALPASVLDGSSGIISHPSGPFWYHSHQHRISAEQVSGGMSGLLAIGARDVNLVATKPSETAGLKARTDTSYLMLRDIQITSAIEPEAADGNAQGRWERTSVSSLCETTTGGPALPPAAQRQGYCQNTTDKSKIWLFTVNGQRYPTVRVPPGRNKLWRIANLSANVTYVISLLSTVGTTVPFDLISIDGTVPVNPVAPDIGADRPEAIRLFKIKLLPAARAEIFLKNDDGDSAERRLILRTEGLDTGVEDFGDRWPEVHLAEVILEAAPPTVVASQTRLGLNAASTRPSPPSFVALALQAKSVLPPSAGCVRDIDKSKREYRRVSFRTPKPNVWKVLTEIVSPPDLVKLHGPDDFIADPSAKIDPVSFEEYLKKDGTVDWDASKPRHTCINLSSGHGQLWEIRNPTLELHNFHLHQTKFRLANEKDYQAYGIDSETLKLPSSGAIKGIPIFSDDTRTVWHDTLPIEPDSSIFIVINFDAEEQLGRYVFHCHILEHEDAGLMAPIEVMR